VKVVQQVRNYLHLNFYKYLFDICGVIRIFLTSLTYKFLFFPSDIFRA